MFAIVLIFLLRALIPKFSKGHIDVGKNAPKVGNSFCMCYGILCTCKIIFFLMQNMREDIDRRLDQTLAVAFEPKLLLDDDKRSTLIADCISARSVPDDGPENKFYTEPPYNYLYRMKTMDDIKKIGTQYPIQCLTYCSFSDKLHPRKYTNVFKNKSIFFCEEHMLENTDVTLKRHPLKDLRQHLRDVRSHSSGVLNSVPSNQIKALIDMYEHARYNPEVCLILDYELVPMIFGFSHL